MSALTIGSLFSGIGGLDLGLERAGLGPVAWQVEREPYCRAVLATHWPDAARFDDVCAVGAHNLPVVDVVCGGFPCQDISYAGKGAGLAGARSGLWYEFARVVRELGPRYVVVENVAALLTRGLGDVLGTLADCGYDAEWSRVSASDVGAPHRRDRLFILAYAERPRLERHAGHGAGGVRPLGEVPQPGGPARADGLRGGARPVPDADGAGRRGVAEHHGAPVGQVAEGAAARLDTDGPRHGLPGARHGARRSADAGAEGSWWRTEPDVGRVADGVPRRVDRLAALGNAVVPQVAEVVGRLIVARETALALRGAA